MRAHRRSEQPRPTTRRTKIAPRAWVDASASRDAAQSRPRSLSERVEHVEDLVEKMVITLLQIVGAGLTRADLSQQRIVDAALEEATSIVTQRTRRRR